jgi:hypothetical protein
MRILLFIILTLAFSVESLGLENLQKQNNGSSQEHHLSPCHKIESDALTSELDGHIQSDRNAKMVQNSADSHPRNCSDTCSDPAHRNHCCGSLLLISSVNDSICDLKSSQKRSAQNSFSAKLAPFLDGPFQPPSARYTF